MGRRPKTFQPNAVLQSAIYAGLAALVRLSRVRVNSKTENFYKSLDRNWRKAWTEWEQSRELDPYDFSSIQNAEPNMRGINLKKLWKDTWRYGNRETKRVYSWQEGTVESLNALLNFAGACLRDLGLMHYRFPKPRFFQIRVYPDKTTKVFPKSVAERLPKDNAIKVYWKAGYGGNRHGPRILLAHPTLPELDFVDIIRAHVIELCKQCYIHGVPMTEAHRYIRLLIHRLRPYLDWVYTQGKVGRPNFNPESDRVLSEIVQEIRALYGRHVGKQKSITRGIEDNSPPDTIEKVRELVARHLEQVEDEEERILCQEILNLIDQGRLEDRDAEKFKNKVLKLVQREGIYWHRILLSDMHHPASLRQVVFAGDKMLEELSPVLIVGELPVGKRIGQTDITLFLRREIPCRTVWTPVMVLEIKSKTALGYNLYGVRTSSTNKKDYGPRFHVWKRKLTKNEWDAISNASTSESVDDQLDAYEKLILQEYRNLVQSDPTPPESLWKGVIVLDTDQSPLEVFDAFQDLLANLAMSLVNDMIDSTELTTYTPESEDRENPLRLTLLLSPSEGPADLVHEMSSPETLAEENPFGERVLDDRIVTLYVSIPSSTSSGNAAAWLSRNWHLLHHLQECKAISENTKICWLDLMGVFKSPESQDNPSLLIRRRFGLDELLQQGHLARVTHRQLTTILESIKFVDLCPEIDLLLSKSSDLSNLIDTLQSILDEDTTSERIVVIDGWTEFRNLVSRDQKQLVKTLERTLLDVLPERSTNIIWIDSGAPHTRMNPQYQRKCIKPFPHDSHRRVHLDEVIYNAPTTPRVFGWKTPRREDARVIIQDTPTSAYPWSTTIDVPFLRDFAEKIRGEARRDGVVPEEDVFRPFVLRPMYGRGVTLSRIAADMFPLADDTVRQIEHDSMTLIPSVLRQRGDMPEEEEREDTPRRVETSTVTSPPKSVSLTERITLCPKQPPPHPSRSKEQYHEAKTITRGWYYDSIPSESVEDDDEGVVRRPPLVTSTDSSEIETSESRELEVRRLFYATEFLMRIVPDYEDLYHCCASITKKCTAALKRGENTRDYLTTLRAVREIICRESGLRRIWNELVPARVGLITLLNSENRGALEETIGQTPDVLELYGNNLFLAIYAVVEELVPEEQKVSVAAQLWSVVAEWIPYQLGFEAQKTEVQAKYDLQAIHSNLRYRTKLLLDHTLVNREPVAQGYGQIIWSEDEEIFDAWVVFQDEEEMVGGLLQGLPEPVMLPKWYGCITNSSEQRNAAQQLLGSTIRTPLTIHRHNNKTVLWVLTVEEEERTQWAPFVLEYPLHPYRESTFLPWLKLTEVPIEIVSELQAPTYIDIPSHVERSVDKYLQSVSTKTDEPIRVTCVVSVNTEKEVYVVKFYEERTVCETLQFRDTKDLVRTLRHPIRKGTGLETSKGLLLMWDHRTDIEYLDIEFSRDDKKETVSLSFLKPLVHRRRFFPEEFYVPRFCSELLSTTMGEQVTMIVRHDDISLRDLRIELEDAPADSSLRALETLGLNIFDLALLTECEQLIASRTKTRHHVEIDAKELFALRFSRLSDYPRLQEAILNLDVSDYDWTRDLWALQVAYPPHLKNEINWSIESTLSRTAWQNRSFTYVLDYTLSIKQVIDNFKDEVSQIVPLKHLTGLSETLDMLRDTLRSRGWQRSRPRCRLDLELRRGEHVAVISRIDQAERLTEIDTFTIDVMKDTDNLYDELIEDEGILSHLDIINIDEFFEKVELVSSDEKEGEDGTSGLDEEIELLQVIRDYRKEQDQPNAPRYLGEALVNLAYLRLSQDRISDAKSTASEALALLRGCDTHNRGVKLSLSKALSVNAEVMLREGKEGEIVRVMLNEAGELVESLIIIHRPDISVQEVRERIDLLLQKYDSRRTIS